MSNQSNTTQNQPTIDNAPNVRSRTDQAHAELNQALTPRPINSLAEASYEILVPLAQKKDAVAMDALLTRTNKILYYTLLKTTGSQELAEELAQVTCVKIFNKIDTIKEPITFVSWARRIAHREFLNYQRGRHSTVNMGEDTTDSFYMTTDHSEEPVNRLIQEERDQHIHRTISGLPNMDREMINLRFFSGLPLKEIGDQLGVAEGTIKRRLHFAKRHFKEASALEDSDRD